MSSNDLSMDGLKELIGLVAAHGVYALSVIFIFYQQRRAVKNLTDARHPSDRAYFRKVNTSVVVATYALVAASTIIWFFGTYNYHPVRTITGEVIGLRKSSAPSELDAGVASQQLAPERSDLEFYPVDDVVRMDGGYRFKWALITTQNVRQVAFRFVHRAVAAAGGGSLVGPVGRSASSPEQRLHERPIERRFVLDIASHSSDRIQLTYRPDEADAMRLGTLWMNRPDGTEVRINWAGQPVAPAEREVHPLSRVFDALLTPLWAQGQEPLFKKDGSYDSDVGRYLVRQLGSSDLRTRLTARQMLVQTGASAYPFINNVLARKITGESSQWPLLLDSVSNAIDEIELRGAPFTSGGHVRLAMAFYDVDDYRAAAYHFEKAGDVTLGDPLAFAKRGHAYIEAGSLSKALQDLNQYLASKPARKDELWARHALCVAYHRAGRYKDAIAECRDALALDPRFASALNGLAYNYAKLGTNLPEALQFIEQALKEEPTSLDFIETKGYVLYKLGRLSEAVELLRSVVPKLPDDKESQDDLKEVEQAIRARDARRFK